MPDTIVVRGLLAIKCLLNFDRREFPGVVICGTQAAFRVSELQKVVEDD